MWLIAKTNIVLHQSILKSKHGAILLYQKTLANQLQHVTPRWRHESRPLYIIANKEKNRKAKDLAIVFVVVVVVVVRNGPRSLSHRGTRQTPRKLPPVGNRSITRPRPCKRVEPTEAPMQLVRRPFWYLWSWTDTENFRVCMIGRCRVRMVPTIAYLHTDTYVCRQTSEISWYRIFRQRAGYFEGSHLRWRREKWHTLQQQQTNQRSRPDGYRRLILILLHLACIRRVSQSSQTTIHPHLSTLCEVVVCCESAYI